MTEYKQPNSQQIDMVTRCMNKYHDDRKEIGEEEAKKILNQEMNRIRKLVEEMTEYKRESPYQKLKGLDAWVKSKEECEKYWTIEEHLGEAIANLAYVYSEAGAYKAKDKFTEEEINQMTEIEHHIRMAWDKIK